MSTLVWVDGRSLWDVGVWGDLEYTLAADGGCDTARVRISGVDPNLAPQMLKRGKTFAVMFGTLPVWTGRVSEFDRGDGVLHAAGAWREAGSGGRGYLAFVSNPHTAITDAKARGLSWTYYNDFPNVDYSSSSTTTNLNYLTQLLDAVAAEQGKRWGVDADNALFMRADDSTPTWVLTPGVGLMGRADDDYVSHIYGRRVSALSGTPAIPSAWATELAGSDKAAGDFGRVEVKVDLTKLGLITQAKAQGILDGMLAQAGARLGYTNAVETTPLHLTSPGGTPAHPALILPGQMVRAFGVMDDGGGTTFGSTLDFVIGEVTVRPGESTIHIEPVDLAARSLADILADPAAREEAFAG